MPSTDAATDWKEIDTWAGGSGWLADPEEYLARASHVLDGEDGPWLVDPVDVDGLDDWLADRGDLRGVVVLFEHHRRDAAAIANRHGVAVHVPHFMDGVLGSLDAPTEPVRHELPDSEYGVHEVIDNALWSEALLYGETSGTLVIGECLGTAGHFCTRHERLGVHPALRPWPPSKVGRLDPERILVGHGPGVFDSPAEVLESAFAGTRRRIPRLYLSNLRSWLPV